MVARCVMVQGRSGGAMTERTAKLSVPTATECLGDVTLFVSSEFC